MQFIADELSGEALYKLLIGLIVPRPIAWVTTLSPEGIVNLAPFSAFTYLSTRPPMIGISITRRAGALKDTARNIERSGEFVVNVAPEDLAEAVHGSSAEFAHDISEVDELGLTVLPSVDVAPPRLSAAPASLECRLEQALEFGEEKQRLIVGRVVRFHVREGLIENGRIDTERLRPLGRIAGPNYASIGAVKRMAPLHKPGHVRRDP